ncbi:hypothetical protein EBB07_16290 [Paenibacillaceae bacterium]|nr:hypothetical protein EBB07_16290 [Paenibacillaceae bacterium]
MKRLSLLICISLMTFFVISCKQPEPDWTYSFIVFEGNIYEVTKNLVNQTESEIGVIEKRIKDEKLYTGIFYLF